MTRGDAQSPEPGGSGDSNEFDVLQQIASIPERALDPAS